MIKLDDVTVLIPVKNEEKAIGKVIDEVLSTGIPPSRILVVDGHSTDRTVEIARSKGVVVVEQEGVGKSDAIKTGLRSVSTKYVVVMDGDYSYPAKYIPILVRLAKEKNYSYISARRVRGRENIPVLNRFGNWILTKLFNILLGGDLGDVCTGMYLLDVEELRDVLFETKGFSIEVELAAHVVGSAVPYTEYGIEYRSRIGRSKLRITDGFKIALDIVRMAWRYNPVTLLLIGASIIVVPGLLLGAYVAYHYIFNGVIYHVKGVVAIVLTATGLQALMLAMVATYLKRAELRIRRLLREILNHSKTRTMGF
ncbi:MAG: glycosyltransferase family 2 protein [Desulfurococcaceae archaeon]